MSTKTCPDYVYSSCQCADDYLKARQEWNEKRYELIKLFGPKIINKNNSEETNTMAIFYLVDNVLEKLYGPSRKL